MLNIIISGAPGCGKGTQSELIVKNFKLLHFSTGDLLRQEIAEQTELGKEAESYISKGNLVPDSMIISIISSAISRTFGDFAGILLDGFPRTPEQAEALEVIMNERGTPISMFIELEVPDRELVQRLLIRGETSGRTDDNLETINKRLEVYKAKTQPVSEFYKTLGKYVTVEGMGQIEDIHSRIAEAIQERFAQ